MTFLYLYFMDGMTSKGVVYIRVTLLLPLPNIRDGGFTAPLGE